MGIQGLLHGHHGENMKLSHIPTITEEYDKVPKLSISP